MNGRDFETIFLSLIHRGGDCLPVLECIYQVHVTTLERYLDSSSSATGYQNKGVDGYFDGPLRLERMTTF